MDLHLVSRRNRVGCESTKLCVVFHEIVLLGLCFLGLFIKSACAWRLLNEAR